jgi:hypothetical protein
MTKAITMETILAQSVEVGECLEWQGPFGTGGTRQTPVIRQYDPDKGYCTKSIVARLVYELTKGPIPEGKLVYRACCNHACVGAHHLKVGTLADKCAAYKKAGKTKHAPSTVAAITRGSRSRSNIKNSMEKARQVRLMVSQGKRDDEIAGLVDMHPEMVADIRRGRSWRESVTASSIFNMGGA